MKMRIMFALSLLTADLLITFRWTVSDPVSDYGQTEQSVYGYETIMDTNHQSAYGFYLMQHPPLHIGRMNRHRTDI